ncbi:MAG: CotH kinase family protein [Myxococcota bacterium]
MLIGALVACTSAPHVARPGEPALEHPVVATSVPAAPDVRGDALFDDTFVHRVEITLPEASRAALLEAPREWAPADLVVDGLRADGVGVRLKGGGSFRELDDKPSWRVETDVFVDGAELDGLDELVLNNMVLDPSMLHERLAYDAYRTLGIPAPRAAHAELWVDGERYGLYTLVEAQDGRFLDRWYADDDGPLFEMFDVDFHPEDVPLFDHDGGPDDRTALAGLADALLVDGPMDDLAPWLDVEAFVAYFKPYANRPVRRVPVLLARLTT